MSFQKCIDYHNIVLRGSFARTIFGHASVTTTEVYARTDAKLKRKAIEAASKEILLPEEAEWDNDTVLRNWRKNFNKR